MCFVINVVYIAVNGFYFTLRNRRQRVASRCLWKVPKVDYYTLASASLIQTSFGSASSSAPSSFCSIHLPLCLFPLEKVKTPDPAAG